ncbi:DUF4058 family protein [Leptolyngbya sp. AN03gr2]|uniref:DUF4058 family protein n=1 Tax=unclassified Leptolyngbya TaxID=2650499 RepID=UPI003D315F26
MPSPFPGMDPYLEQAVFWASFHQRLLVAIADRIGPQLRPKYYVDVETRTYFDDEDEELMVGIPDTLVLSPRREPETAFEVGTALTQTRPQQVQLPMSIEVRERFLEVREVGTDAVITVIEVLSPKNKRTGEGRMIYERKRRSVLNSLSHLVEIDLLRGGRPMAMTGATRTQYRIVVSQAQNRPTADLYGFSLREVLPSFLLPLKPDDSALVVELQAIFTGVYDRASYDLRLPYDQPVPPPTLSAEDQAWVQTQLQSLSVQ